MFDLKKVVPAAFFAGALMVAGSAQAVPVDLANLIANHGGGDGDFDATNFGDLDVPPTTFGFGPIQYDGAFLNPNGIPLGTTDLATAQANVGAANQFVNGFTFNAHSVIDGFAWTAQINESAPAVGAGDGFLDFRITFLDVTGTGSANGGLLEFSQADINAATVIGDAVLTNSTDGSINFNPIADLPFFQLSAPDAQILALVSGNAFSDPNNATNGPNYIISASVPLPAPVVLLISALVGLGFLGRRKLRV